MSQFWKPGSKLIKSKNGSEDKNEKAVSVNSRNSIAIKRQQDNNSPPNVPDSASKLGLSKSVMSMKFMKRKADENSIENEEKNRKMKVTELMWSESRQQSHLQTEKSELICEKDESDVLSLFPGRRSFGGFNKAVERYFQKYLDDQKLDRIVTTKTVSSKYDVDDKEMLERYDQLIGLPRGPNQGKRIFEQNTKKVKTA